MILQALSSYYERAQADPAISMPAYGTSMENISFALVLDPEGNVVALEDLREQDGKKLRPRKMAVAAAEKKASGIKANFLWDSTNYVLGADDKGNPERTRKCHEAFVELTRKFCSDEDPGLKAVLSFLDKPDKDFSSFPQWEEMLAGNVVFRLDGVEGFIHDRPAARAARNKWFGDKEKEISGQCLISGDENTYIARLHPSIKGVYGAQVAGASIVSFNKSAFESYGKKQSYNAPVSVLAAFQYVTALNSLLARDSRQRMTIGDSTIVFWAERKSVLEDFLAECGFCEPRKGEEEPEVRIDVQTSVKIHDLLLAIRQGRRAVDIVPGLDESVRFYLLALAPNASRLSIRFWEVNTVGGILDKISRFFQDIEIVRMFENEPEFPSLWRLLVQTATLGKSENISPVLAGGMAKSMLSGGPYPQSLLAAILGRIRAEQAVTYFRAALLKAFLVRNCKMEVSVALDPSRTDRPYLLGRLFAVLEKAQEEAIPGASATIKDRYLGSAAANPGQVFSVLLKNASNHIAKLRKDPERKGFAFSYDVMMQDIVSKFDDFPRTMSAENQGLFMIGYYHQRKDFFTKKNKEN